MINIENILNFDEINIEAVAKETVIGSGKDLFLSNLSEAFKGDMDSFNNVVRAIRTGFIGDERIKINNRHEACEIIYGLAHHLTKVRYYILNGELKRLYTDDSFQEAVLMLYQCYYFGAGVDVDIRIAEMLDLYIVRDEVLSNDS